MAAKLALDDISLLQRFCRQTMRVREQYYRSYASSLALPAHKI